MTPIAFIPPDLRRFEKLPATLLVLYRFAEMRPLRGIAGLVDWRLGGHLSRRIIDRFIDGRAGEPLLVPLGGRLPLDHLLLIGLGDRSGFGQARFCESVERAFDAAKGLGHQSLAMALPGRAERVPGAAEAIAWFLGCYESRGGGLRVQIIEPADAQKAMSPIVERWRLRHLVPPPPPSQGGTPV